MHITNYPVLSNSVVKGRANPQPHKPMHYPRRLDPQLHRNQMVEFILTKENPTKIMIVDEETLDNRLTQFGAACAVLPSNAPQQMSYRNRQH